MLVFFTLVSTVLGLIYLFLTWNDTYWENYGIPFEKPKLFFGNFKEALTGKQHFGLIYVDLYRKFENALYCGFFKLRTPVVIIRDRELAKNILVKDFNNFCDNDFHCDPIVDPILGGNPFVRTGDDWKNIRGQWSSSMTSSRVKMMVGVMEDKGKTMVEYLNNHIKNDGGALETRELGMRYLTDVIVTSVFGLQSNSFTDKNNVFHKIASSLFVANFWEGLVVLFYIIAPWIIKYFKLGFISKEVKKNVLDISRFIVDNRKKNGYAKNDFFETLIKENEVDGKVDYDAVGGRVFGYLSEGIETSSGLIGFTLFELAAHPHVQTKLRKELDEAAESNGGSISYDQIHTLPYLDMVTSEVLRIYPPAFTLQRLCNKPYSLPPAVKGAAPFEIPAGMPVNVSIYAFHHDPENFPDPDKFDPERFTEEGKAQIPKYAYMPFGEGPRICVGTRLALTQSKLGISYVVRNFELRVSPRTAPRPLPMDPTTLMARAVGDLWVTFHKRTS